MDDSTRGTGWITYAGIMLVIGGISAVLTAGRAWRYDDTPIDTLFYDDNLTVWGWVFLVLGVLTIVAGVAVMSRQAQWARWFGVVVSALVIFSRLSFMFVYPWESLLQVLLAALVIYGLVAHGDPLIPARATARRGRVDTTAVAATPVAVDTTPAAVDTTPTAVDTTPTDAALADAAPDTTPAATATGDTPGTSPTAAGDTPRTSPTAAGDRPGTVSTPAGTTPPGTPGTPQTQESGDYA